MLRFAANLTMLFPELSLPDRFQAARDAGFGAVVVVVFPFFRVVYSDIVKSP